MSTRPLSAPALLFTLLATTAAAQEGDRFDEPGLAPFATVREAPSPRVDPMVDKARRAGEEILERRRRLDDAGALPPALERAILDARERAVAIDEELASAYDRRDELAQRSARLEARRLELETAAAAAKAQRARRVGTIYMQARLGPAAAGWPTDRARTLRMARYLASIASVQSGDVARLDLEAGAALAAADRARADESSAVERLRVLAAERAVAQSEALRAEGDATAFARRTQREEEAIRAAEVEEVAAAAEAALPARRKPPEQPTAEAVDTVAADAEAFVWPPSAVASFPERDDARDDALAPMPGQSEPEELAVTDGAPEDPASQETAPPETLSDPGSPVETAPEEVVLAEPEMEAAASSIADEPALHGAAEPALGDPLTFAGARGTLAPPVRGSVIATFGQQHSSGATYRGVIVRARRGDEVASVADGRVIFSGPLEGLDETVIVTHGDGYHTVYARLGSARPRVGARVQAGEVLGALPADDGDLHFELRENGAAVDPAPWIRGGLSGFSR